MSLTNPALLHPGTGRRYVQVFWEPSDIYCDWKSAYEALAKDCPWIATAPHHALPGLVEKAGEETVFVCWHHFEDLPARRKAKAVLYWPETVGDPPSMTAYQSGLLDKLVGGRAFRYDAVLVNDRLSQSVLELLIGPVGLCPTGYDPEVMGRPDWAAPKGKALAYYGSLRGVRELIMPAVERFFRDRLDVFSGVYGKDRAARLSKASAILMVPHSMGSFPQHRLWHAVASSAALLSPWGAFRAWPARPERHYVQIPFPDVHRLEVFVEAVSKALSREDLPEIARRAHLELGSWSVRKMFDQYMVPEIERVMA